MKINAAVGLSIIVLVLCGEVYSASRVFYSNTFDTADSLNDFVIFGEQFIGYDPPPLHEVRIDSGQLLIETDLLRPNGPGTSPALTGRAAVMMDTSLVEEMEVYNTILGMNTGIISWTVNLSNQNGGFNNSFIVILISSTADPYASGAKGYAFQGGGYVRSRMILWRFSNGLGESPPRYLIDITDGLENLPQKGSFKITYNPTTNEWALYGYMGVDYVNPVDVNSLLGTATDSSYTDIDTPYFGVIGRTSGVNYFDNLMISVNDGKPPSILSHNPNDAADNVATNAIISVEFSEPMNRATVNQSSILISDGINDIEGIVTYQDSTATFTPIVPLNCSTTYTVNVLTNAEDLFGNPLPEKFFWSFTTSAAGQCGCGIEDIDTDGDGVMDCIDDCPLSEEKTVPGVCGCSLPETDTDGDTTEDCIDDDDDNDGVSDEMDAFPLNSHESIDTDDDGIGNNTDLDDDGDSIPDITENDGPNNGDSNQDGTPDSIQDHIISIISGDGINFMTLELPQGKRFINCSIEGNPSAQESPSGFSFPYGFIRFVVSDIQINEVVPVTLHFPDNYWPDSYFKFGKTPDNQTEHWYEFLFDGQTGAEIKGNILTIYFQDGKRGDDVQELDGMIIDIGGPGSINQNSQAITTMGGGGGAGCFIVSIF